MVEIKSQGLFFKFRLSELVGDLRGFEENEKISEFSFSLPDTISFWIKFKNLLYLVPPYLYIVIILLILVLIFIGFKIK